MLNSGAFHISEVFRGAVVWGMMVYPLHGKVQIIASCTLHH